MLSTENHNTEVWAERRKRETDSYMYVQIIKCMSKIHLFHTIVNTDIIGSFDTEEA